MNSCQQRGGTRKFFFRQAILLVVTIVLLAFFTVPLIKAVKAASNPGELEENLKQGKQELARLDSKVAAVQSKITMDNGDDETAEKLTREVELLKRQMAFKDLQNKQLENQIIMVQAMLQVMNAKSVPAPVPNVDFWQKLIELATKVVGGIASVFGGVMFLVGWWRKRTQPAESGAQVLAK